MRSIASRVLMVMMSRVRTTITLDPDTRLLVERAMRERGLSFKDAVDEAIRAGLGDRPFREGSFTAPHPLGPARMDLTRALVLAERLEDDELPRRLVDGR